MQTAMLRKASALTRSVRCLSSGSAVPELPPCDFQPQKYTGPSADELNKLRANHVNPAIFTLYKKPLSLHQGHMQYLYDLDGNRYLDMIAGIATVIAGHCHPKIQEAAFKAMGKLWHVSNIYTHPELQIYTEKLTSKLPEHLQVCYLVNSGSEANDLALFMARMYSGCMDSLVFRGAYHGSSPFTMGLTSLGSYKYNYPSTIAIHKMRNPDPYKGPWGGRACRDSPVQTDRSCSCAPGACEASDRYLEEVEDVLAHCVPKNKMGAFFAESIQGNSGAMQFPKNYLKRAFELVQSRGGVCVSDEVQTGFGRTGEHYWGFEAEGVKPDIVTMAKGIGNGFPLAAVVTTREVAQVMTQSLHFNTFGGNPVASAIGSAVIDAIEEDGLQQNADKLGTYFLVELGKLRDEFEVVGDVRGKGLMIGVELVNSKESRAPLPADQMTEIFEDLKDMRLLAGKGGIAGHILRFKPPMCITKDDIDFTLSCLRIALKSNQERRVRG